MFEKLVHEARKSPLELVAQVDRVRLYRDRIELLPSNRPEDRALPAQTKSLTGVRACIGQRDGYLAVTGPGFQWAVRTDSGWSARQLREFAALINSTAPGAYRMVTARRDECPAPDLAGQVAKLAELHRAGALTDEEFTAAKARLLR